MTYLYAILINLLIVTSCFAYTVRDIHPRLYINSTNAAEIRTRAANGNSDMYHWMMNSTARFGVEAKYNENISSWSRQNRMNYVLRSAFVYTVGTVPGYTYPHTMAQYGEKGKEALIYWARNDDHGEQDLPYAVVGYDHFYHLLTTTERKTVVDAIIEASESCIAEQGKTYTRFGSKAPGLSRWVMAGLGFYGDGNNIGDGSQSTYYNNKAKEYCDDYDTYFKNGTMAAHNWLQGMWFSPDYSSYCTRLVWIMEAWNTATTDVNTYNDFTDWYKGVPMYYAHSSAPYNKDIVRFGDVRFAHTGFNDASTLQESLGVILAAIRYRASANGDSTTANLANWLIVDNNMHNYSSTWFFPWDAPSANHDGPAALGLNTYYAFMNEGLYFARSSWTDPNATYVGFTSHTYYLSNHESADAGSFIIYKKDPLAIRSGCYASGDKKNHERNYHYRTIAENSILIYDPNEIWHWDGAAGAGTNASNDGGQRWFNDSPYDLSDLVPGSKWDAGGFDKITMSDEFDYILTDITEAYTSKAQLVQREFLYLKNGDYIIVFDRLAKDADKYSVFLLHSKTQPVISANEIKISSNGGYLTCNVAYPLSANITKLGGEGHRFEDLEGNNYPQDTTWVPRWDPEFGDYRVEIKQPSNNSKEYYLTVLHPALTASSVRTTSLETDDSIGVFIDDAVTDKVAIFSKAPGFTATDLIEYTVVPTSDIKHYIFDLAPNTNYSIAETVAGPNLQISITKDIQGNFTSSSEGVLTFTSHRANAPKPQIQSIQIQ